MDNCRDYPYPRPLSLKRESGAKTARGSHRGVLQYAPTRTGVRHGFNPVMLSPPRRTKHLLFDTAESSASKSRSFVALLLRMTVVRRVPNRKTLDSRVRGNDSLARIKMWRHRTRVTPRRIGARCHPRAGDGTSQGHQRMSGSVILACAPCFGFGICCLFACHVRRCGLSEQLRMTRFQPSMQGATQLSRDLQDLSDFCF